MVKKISTDSQERLEKFIQHLEAARQLQNDILTYGLKAANLYVEDVDGDWLEKWGEEDQPEMAGCDRTLVGREVIESVTAFLESDDSVAVRIRERLEERSLPEIAADLVKCRSIPQEDDQRLFAVKTILASSMNASETRRDLSFGNPEISLLDLAKDLLDKLAEIWGKQE